jgi:ATP-dependent helicase HrpB
VVQAPPGAGKTTRIPLALLDEAWLRGQRIVMLEPRRLAARAAAGYMARLRGEAVGGTVGYRVRLDTRIGAGTRIEVVTEGVLTRMLQSDPALDGVGLVIFDEFHERTVHADLGLALTLHARSLVREDLRILVMSATLDAAPVAALLGDAPVLTTTGRAHPVAIRWRSRPVDGWIEAATTGTILSALEATEGDVLVFLPGAAEIRRVEAQLHEHGLPRSVTTYGLYGRLSQAAQDSAIAPARSGARKVVLATSIAETSLTIEGVRTVVDAGLMRVPRFSPRTGLTALETVPVTRASAEQRCGRAGRLGPGTCYRLWTEAEHAARIARGTPEILEADLAPLALELAAWGVRDAAELRWLDAPPAAALGGAFELLHSLDALDADGRITEHGRRMASLPLHPRLAHMLLRARDLQLGATAADLAALLAERDIVRGDGPADPDVAPRIAALESPGARDRAHPGGLRFDSVAARRARAERDHWRRRLRVPAGVKASAADAGVLLAFAYPDRIAALRPGARGRFLLRTGRGATMDAGSALADAPFIVAAGLEGHGRESRIHLAAPLARADLEDHFGKAIVAGDVIEWDHGALAVRAVRRTRLGAILLAEAPLRTADAERTADVLLDAILAPGALLLHWTKRATQLRQRIAFLHTLDPSSWPAVSDAALAGSAMIWLRPFLGGIRSADELRRLDLEAALLTLVPREQRARLDALAPTHLQVPSGSRVPIDYGDAGAPAVAVRLQELFGLTETPRAGDVPLTLRLLSPAHRPVQITRDLASFWKEGYYEVRKDLRGRYPKHHWPDDPIRSEPTRRTKGHGP